MTAEETVARRVEPLDHGPVRTQRAGPFVGDDAALGAEVAGDDLDRVERALVDAVQRRVRLHLRVRVVAVVGALAAVEVLVDAGLGEGVEPGHGLRQRVGRHVDPLGELGERVGPLHRAVLVPAAGERLPRGEAGEEVPVAVALVDDHPCGDVRDPGGLTGVDRVGRLHVGQRLVHESLACGVHDDRAGQVALREAEPRAAGERDRRTPPGVVHQVDRGTHGDAGLDAAAGVARGSRAPVGVGGAGQVLLAQGVVLLEAAGPEDDSPTGADDDLGSIALGADADHPAALDDQPGERGLVVDRDVGFKQGLAQADRQGVAHREHPPAAEGADHLVEQHPEHGARAAEGAQGAEADLAEVGLGDDQVRRRLGVRRVQSLQLGADDPAVHRYRFHACVHARARPAARAGSRSTRAPTRSAPASSRAGSR